MMKKITYIAVAALSLAACTKAELAPEKAAETSGKHDIEVAVTVGGDTKASFDGSNFIQFASGDRFYGFIAKKDEPKKGIIVSDYRNPGEDDYDYYSSFTIDDYKAAHPVFNGHLYCIEEKDFADEYCFYGLFPYTASYYGSDITKWPITLKQEQNRASQTSWDGSADAMIMQPTTISTTGATQDKLGDYSCVYSGTVANFAHLFGFAKISFAGIPAKYADQIVKSVQIQAVGDNKDLTGRYYVDLTTGDPDQELGSYVPSDYAKITPSDKVKIGDYKAWFVLKPGTYDVQIRVSTLKADFVFERQGLVIERSKIAEPTVNYKEADVTETHELVLAEGETWNANFKYSSDFISSSYPEREWGPTAKKMVFSLSYPGSTNNNYGSYLGDYSSGYVQGFAYQNIIGGKVVLSSATSFSGASTIKTKFGIYNSDVTADFNVSLVDDGTVTDLGTVTVIGDNSNLNGKMYIFSNTENKKGELVITVSNFSDTNCRPYLALLEINPLPEVVLGETAVKLSKDAATASVDCTVAAASGDPTVTVSEDAADWLTASYTDGKITYTVLENAGSKRKGTITVTASRGTITADATLVVTQQSATAVEYKLTVTAKDVKDAIAAAKAAGQTFSDVDALTAKFNAVATDGSGKTSEVEIKFDKLYCNDDEVTDSFKIGSTSYSSTTSEIGVIEDITFIASTYAQASPNTWSNLAAKTSADGSIWNYIKGATYTKDGDYYTNKLVNGDETQTWFQIFIGWGITVFKSFDVTYVAD